MSYLQNVLSIILLSMKCLFMKCPNAHDISSYLFICSNHLSQYISIYPNKYTFIPTFVPLSQPLYPYSRPYISNLCPFIPTFISLLPAICIPNLCAFISTFIIYSFIPTFSSFIQKQLSLCHKLKFSNP